MRKELRPIHEALTCGSCGRTILKGERTELYFTPDDAATVVCELCVVAVEREGWVRESERAEIPAAWRRQEPRRSLWDRLRRPRDDDGSQGPNGREPDVAPSGGLVGAARSGADPVRGLNGTEGAESPPPSQSRPPTTPLPPGAEAPSASSGPKDPRHVRAVPMTAEVKVQHALELFNSSEHRRTVAGIARSLGTPWVSAAVVPDSSSEVGLVVAWEFSWYRYRVDLAEAVEPVTLLDKGRELSELQDPLLEWNGSAALDGRLLVGAAPGR